MPIYKGNKLICTIKGSRNIGKFYHASSLMFQIIPVNTVLFSIRNPGTYSFTIPTSQNYRTTVVDGWGRLGKPIHNNPLCNRTVWLG